jgi:hypothetical protein
MIAGIVGMGLWLIADFLDPGPIRAVMFGAACLVAALAVEWITVVRRERQDELAAGDPLNGDFGIVAGIATALAFAGFFTRSPGHMRPTLEASVPAVGMCVVPVLWWTSDVIQGSRGRRARARTSATLAADSERSRRTRRGDGS